MVNLFLFSFICIYLFSVYSKLTFAHSFFKYPQIQALCLYKARAQNSTQVYRVSTRNLATQVAGCSFPVCALAVSWKPEQGWDFNQTPHYEMCAFQEACQQLHQTPIPALNSPLPKPASLLNSDKK